MAASGVQEHNEAIRKERVLMRKAHMQLQQQVNMYGRLTDI